MGNYSLAVPPVTKLYSFPIFDFTLFRMRSKHIALWIAPRPNLYAWGRHSGLLMTFPEKPGFQLPTKHKFLTSSSNQISSNTCYSARVCLPVKNHVIYLPVGSQWKPDRVQWSLVNTRPTKTSTCTKNSSSNYPCVFFSLQFMRLCGLYIFYFVNNWLLIHIYSKIITLALITTTATRQPAKTSLLPQWLQLQQDNLQEHHYCLDNYNCNKTTCKNITLALMTTTATRQPARTSLLPWWLQLQQHNLQKHHSCHDDYNCNNTTCKKILSRQIQWYYLNSMVNWSFILPVNSINNKNSICQELRCVHFSKELRKCQEYIGISKNVH